MNISQAINTILNMPLRQACMPLLETDYARFFDVPASLSHHHCGDGGLAPQSLEALILHQADMLSAHCGLTK